MKDERLFYKSERQLLFNVRCTRVGNESGDVSILSTVPDARWCWSYLEAVVGDRWWRTIRKHDDENVVERGRFLNLVIALSCTTNHVCLMKYVFVYSSMCIRKSCVKKYRGGMRATTFSYHSTFIIIIVYLHTNC